MNSQNIRCLVKGILHISLKMNVRDFRKHFYFFIFINNNLNVLFISIYIIEYI